MSNSFIDIEHVTMTIAALDRDYMSKSPIQRIFKLSLRHFLQLSEVNRASVQGSENFKHHSGQCHDSDD